MFEKELLYVSFGSAVVTGLEPATLGVTGRYSKPTELHDYVTENFFLVRKDGADV